MEILENREEWLATFRAGWLAHFESTGQFDWSLYNRPRNSQAPAGPAVDPARSRLMLITTAGAYLRDSQPPFDDAHPLGDYTVRLWPGRTPFSALGLAHDHYDHQAVQQDPQVLLPLRHLEDLVSAGEIGALTDHVVSFMGYQPVVTRVLDETIPAVLRAAQAEAAEAALLVPA